MPADTLARTAAPRRRKLAGVAWGLTAVTIWSGSFVLIRLGVTTSLTPYDITALRFGFAAAMLLPIVCRRGLALDRLGLGGLAILIAGTGAPYALLIALGLRFAPASRAAALVPGLMAVIVPLLAGRVLRERVSAATWWGAGAILIGSLLLAGEATADEVPGLAAFLFAALLWAGYVVVLRQAQLPALTATAIVAVGSALLYLPLYAALRPAGFGQAPLADIAVQAIYQGGLTTVVGLVAFSRAVALLGAAAGAAWPALVPAVTLVLAAAVLHEQPGPSGVAAAGLIGLGVLLANTRSHIDDKEKRT
jgi:drug/metabolite transporter (DMT)-like permease